MMSEFANSVRHLRSSSSLALRHSTRAEATRRDQAISGELRRAQASSSEIRSDHAISYEIRRGRYEVTAGQGNAGDGSI
eukprot:4979932-Prymnesium_polylepis.2